MATDLNTEDVVFTEPSKTAEPVDDTASESLETAKRIAVQIVETLGELPRYFGEFFDEYKRPLLALGLIFGAFISVKLTLAILDAIHDVPVLAPLFELIGLIYSGWFIYRYLLKASNRSELASEMNAFKDQILGRASQL